MTRAEQKRFVRDLSKNIQAKVIDKIDRGLIPEEWDGIELREFLAEKYDDSRATFMRMKGERRAKEYHNTVLVNNL